MTSAMLPPLDIVHDGARLLTVADVAALPSHLPSGDVRYELHDGRLVIAKPLSDRPSRSMALFLAHLYIHGDETGTGHAYGRVGIIIRRNPDHILVPVAAFLTTAQLPPRTSPEDYLVTIPELIVEVRSETDTQQEIEQKVIDYLNAGAVLVWIVDPNARTVKAYEMNEPPLVFNATDTLTALPVIPGFAVLVSELLPV